MSKVDAMRALKQARLEQLRSSAPSRPAPARPAATAAPATARPTTRSTAPAPADESDGACGHRNMGGRSCTRASGHSEKSHRYG